MTSNPRESEKPTLTHEEISGSWKKFQDGIARIKRIREADNSLQNPAIEPGIPTSPVDQSPNDVKIKKV